MDETPANAGEWNGSSPLSVCSGLNFSDLSSSGPEKKESKIMLTVIEEYSRNVTKSTFNKLTIKQFLTYTTSTKSVKEP